MWILKYFWDYINSLFLPANKNKKKFVLKLTTMLRQGNRELCYDQKLYLVYGTRTKRKPGTETKF